MSAYPPEVQKIIRLAERIHGTPSSDVQPLIVELDQAVDAYRKSIAPPEPFEAYMLRAKSGSWDSGHFQQPPEFSHPDAQLWRCTVTPTERVK